METANPATSLFADPVWESMDWLSQATEPYVFSVVDLYASLPDVVEITFDQLLNQLIGKTHSLGGTLIDIGNCLYSSLLTHYPEVETSSFSFCISDFYNMPTGSIHMNFEEKTLCPSMYFEKKPQYMTTQAMFKILFNSMSRVGLCEGEIQKQNVKEVLNILGVRKIVSRIYANTSNQLPPYFINHLIDICENDSWKIRNLDLFLKLTTWINRYIRHTTADDLANILKLKCATHYGQPIYDFIEVSSCS